MPKDPFKGLDAVEEKDLFEGLDAQEVQDPFAGLVDEVPQEQAAPSQPSQIGEAIKYGLSQQIAPTLGKVFKQDVEFGPLGEAQKAIRKGLEPSPEFKPTTPAEKVVSTVTSFIDPAFGPIGQAGAAIAKPVLKGLGLTSKAAKLAKLAEIAEKGELLAASSSLKATTPAFKEAIKEATADINKRILLNEYAQVGVKSAGAGAAIGGAEGAKEQLVSGEFDPVKLAKQAASGAAFGVVAGPVLKGAVQLGGKALARVKIKLAPDKTVDTALVEGAKNRAQKTTKKLVKRGIVDPKNRDVMSQKLFLDELERKGFVQPGEVMTPAPARGFLNNIEQADAIDRKLGTRLTESIQRNTQAEFQARNLQTDFMNRFGEPTAKLQKLGVKRDKITELLQEVDLDKNGTLISSPRINILPDPVKKELVKIRQVFNEIFQNNPEFAERAGFRQGYVPALRKRAGLRAGDLKPGSTKQVEDVFFLKPRTKDRLDPLTDEMDFGTVANIYSKAASKHLAFNKHLPQMYSELTKLRWLGRGKEAQEMAKVFMRSMGIKDRVNIDRVFSNEVAKGNNAFLQEIAQETLNPRSFMAEATNAIKKVTFDNLVFLNPRTILFKQPLQPELVGSGEIGFKAIARGRMLDATKKGRKLAEQFMDQMRSKDASAFAELRFDGAKNKFIRVAEGLSEVGAKPGKFLFNKLDVQNRRVAFLGARDQFVKNAAQDLEGTLDGLLFGEKEIVKRVLRTQGEEAAANMYAIIRARRINYAYGIADSPQFFAEGIGRHIPFTTWGRNQMARVVGDVRDRNVKKLAQRVAKPLAMLSLFKLMTGYEIPGAHPLAAIPGAIGTEAFPMVSEVKEQYAIRGPGAAITAAKQFTPIGPVERAFKRHKKTKDYGESVLRLKRADKKSFTEKFRKQLFR